MLRTRLTERWGLRHPIVCAPMAGAAEGELARAVSAAGALGMIGVGSSADRDWLLEQAETARRGGAFGIGLSLWMLPDQPELVDWTLEARPDVVSLSFGDPAPWIEQVRETGARVVTQVQDSESLRIALDAGVDAVVAQGVDAGGHTGPMGSLPLLQLVLEHVDDSDVLVLAAGGIATGRAIAGVLAMGADGAWIGTRFEATQESVQSRRAKERIVAAGDRDTVWTSVFDIAQQLPWPQPIAGRALRNDFTDRWHGREEELREHLQEAARQLEKAREQDDYSTMYVYAGQCSALIHDLPAAADLVERLAHDAERALGRAMSALSDPAAAPGS